MKLTLCLALLLSVMLAACGRQTPKAHIDPCMDPCAGIAVDGSHLDIGDPNSEYSKKWKKTCEDLRRQKHWSPCWMKAPDIAEGWFENPSVNA